MGILTFKRDQVTRMLDTAVSETAPVYLVADRGVYLMSQTQPNGGHIAYAVNLSPNDEDWWDRKRERLGGDDFGEQVGTVESWRDMLADSVGSIKLNVSEKSISVAVKEFA